MENVKFFGFETYKYYVDSLEENCLPDPYALYRLCVLALRQGESDEALLFSSKRTESVFLRLQAEALLKLGDLHGALKALSKAARKNPRDAKISTLINSTVKHEV